MESTSLTTLTEEQLTLACGARTAEAPTPCMAGTTIGCVRRCSCWPPARPR
jgi:hypothetical protein